MPLAPHPAYGSETPLCPFGGEPSTLVQHIPVLSSTLVSQRGLSFLSMKRARSSLSWDQDQREMQTARPKLSGCSVVSVKDKRHNLLLVLLLRGQEAGLTELIQGGARECRDASPRLLARSSSLPSAHSNRFSDQIAWAFQTVF